MAGDIRLSIIYVPGTDASGNGPILRVKVMEGRNLAIRDKSGFSDPYVVLRLGKKVQLHSIFS